VFRTGVLIPTVFLIMQKLRRFHYTAKALPRGVPISSSFLMGQITNEILLAEFLFSGSCWATCRFKADFGREFSRG